MKREGRLGAEVRRLRREKAARSLQEARTPLAGQFSSLVAAFECIHAGEDSWTDPGAPYYGGVQADLAFQQTYAPELLRLHGTADHWTPVQQVAMAILAWTERGFEPWPVTSRACGLR